MGECVERVVLGGGSCLLSWPSGPSFTVLECDGELDSLSERTTKTVERGKGKVMSKCHGIALKSHKC